MHLEQLHLDDNRIESMHSGTFRKLPELRWLSLARNRIKELAPRLFLSLAKLTRLDLSGNPLEDLNPEVFKDVQVSRQKSHTRNKFYTYKKILILFSLFILCDLT